jgi:hypothetical protein
MACVGMSYTWLPVAEKLTGAILGDSASSLVQARSMRWAIPGAALGGIEPLGAARAGRAQAESFAMRAQSLARRGAAA